ncbi:hypothetical protein AZI86_03455 [Bdellovibrio bacteriovorus]|uniref:DUF4097 domain-containing protein n=1 Tax=Bdellovibrio bacteriovorus TaxID=959 RepID=A0A150WNQ1_BDEBC|nr:DUF4097 family beta strand repeat-containing protein [Bdellovibrio bacteriovorus]KYG66131.1 hypothetical protein AZI86_03455 [Bdellovibrio bacteriovorus]
MLKKIFLTFIALFFILFGSLILMMGYVFNNPEKVFTAFSSMTEKFMDAQDYEEHEEFFIQGIETLKISTQAVDLNVQTYEGSSLKISLHGKVPRFDSGPYILQTPEQNGLLVELYEPQASQWIQFNVNGQEYTKESDSRLQADIYVPQSYKKTLNISSKDGSVTLKLPETAIYETDLKSASGEITNELKEKPTSNINPQEVGRIEVSTDKGSITLQPL